MRLLKNVPKLKDIKDQNPAMKAIIFDMDGTLINTEPLHAEVHKKVIEKLANKESPLSANELERIYKGLADNLVFEEFKNDSLIEEKYSLEDFQKAKDEIIDQEIEELKIEDIMHLSIRDFIVEALKDGLRVSLVTASERDMTLKTLKSLNLFDLFELVRTNNDFKNSKPNPEPYLKTIEEMGLNISDVVIFEDSDAGVEAATRSGAPMYKVTWYL
jgi:putative hydrolase of the HAD superfamily